MKDSFDIQTTQYGQHSNSHSQLTLFLKTPNGSPTYNSRSSISFAYIQTPQNDQYSNSNIQLTLFPDHSNQLQEYIPALEFQNRIDLEPVDEQPITEPVNLIAEGCCLIAAEGCCNIQ
jgi:hypothetical protein